MSHCFNFGKKVSTQTNTFIIWCLLSFFSLMFLLNDQYELIPTLSISNLTSSIENTNLNMSANMENVENDINFIISWNDTDLIDNITHKQNIINHLIPNNWTFNVSAYMKNDMNFIISWSDKDFNGSCVSSSHYIPQFFSMKHIYNWTIYDIWKSRIMINNSYRWDWASSFSFPINNQQTNELEIWTYITYEHFEKPITWVPQKRFLCVFNDGTHTISYKIDYPKWHKYYFFVKCPYNNIENILPFKNMNYTNLGVTLFDILDNNEHDIRQYILNMYFSSVPVCSTFYNKQPITKK
eukprot:541804_1